MDLAAYARLLVKVGVDLRAGQELYIDGETSDAPLVQALARAAYDEGASYVDVNYADPWLQRAFVDGAPEEKLNFSPPHMVARLERMIENGYPIIRLHGAPNESILAGADGTRLAKARMEELRKVWLGGIMAKKFGWCIASYPTQLWADEAFDGDFARLEKAVSQSMRLDLDDPAAAWKERIDQLMERSALLTERSFDSLRYRGPGTDLEIGLIPGARWISGAQETTDGIRYIANLPTEECFTSPDPARADGHVRSSKPLIIRGGVVEGLEFEFKGGEITEVRATKGEDIVRADIATDEGARRLGEVALVDDSSRVGQTGEVFRNTLFDENAASHIAWGAGYEWPIQHLEPGTAAVNKSTTHIDVMVGSSELEIDGIEPGGAAVPLLRGGAWQLTG
jgi:aminopeptidase